MAGFQIKARDLAKTKLDLPNDQKHKIVVIRPSLFVLDVEDSHFNFDRSVLLPDLSTTDGSTPVLDTRRVTGIGVIFAALTHAKKNPSQGTCVTGHADAKGGASYNQTLSEDRGKNVSLFLRGQRDDWRKASAAEDNVDDVQRVLKWQSERAGWDCDPGDIDNKLGPDTREAIGEFQKRYNEEVDRAKDTGADSPFRTKVAVDNKVGKEVWGAIYDLYMDELMDLFDTDKVSDVEALQAQIKVPPGMKDFVGCGEHIPFNPARRNPFEKGNDEHLEGPQKNPPDRRVEILFFDPGEEVPQVCHPKPGKCDPTKCPIYIVHPFRQKPIGIPKGLPIAEVNLRLSFRDPEGKLRPFPEGLEIEAKFGDPKDDPGSPDDLLLNPDDDDGSTDDAAADAAPEPDPSQADPDAESMAVDQEPNEKTQAGGLLQFVIPRKASSLYLRFLAGPDKCFVTADPKTLDDQKLATLDEAMADVAKGRVFFKLPKEFNTQEGYFDDLSGPVKFKDGRFVDVDNRETQIGSRESPMDLVLEIHWQHFKFEYFDRWTSSVTAVPQPRSKDDKGADVPALVMDGMPFIFDAKSRPEGFVRSAWDVKNGKDTIHCLGWVRGDVDNTASPPKKRDLPDDTCTARFTSTDLFVRTEGDGSSPDGARNFVTVAAGDPLRTNPTVDRLRLYDVPADWRSTDYPVRMDGDGQDKIQPFKNLAKTKTSVSKAFVASLDTIVLDDVATATPSPTLDDGSVGHVENRIAIYDNQLNVYKPDAGAKEPYFTKVADLKPKPASPVLLDFPPFTRLITRGPALYDVFQDRSCDPDIQSKLPAGFPLGARLAKQPPANVTVGGGQNRFYVFHPTYFNFKPNGTAPVSRSFAGGALGILRCCGHQNGKVEQFVVFEYMSVNFNFNAVPQNKNETALKNPPSGAVADAKSADCLVKAAARWNGTPVDFHIGQPETASGRWRYLLARGQASAGANPVPFEVRINIFEERRASQGGQVGNWKLADMDIVPVDGAPTSFTAAHELGHAMSLPDEYLNTDDDPSGFRPNISEISRSPGQPFGFDLNGQMVEGMEFVRAHSFWHIMLFAREQSYFTDAAQIMIEHGTAKLTTDLTPRDQNRVQFPVDQALNVNLAPSPGTGFCDQFVYVMGADEVGGGVLGGSSAGNSFDGFICVRVKMEWHFDNTTDLDDMSSMLARSHGLVTARFNVSQHLVARGTFGGKAVRLRYLFCPRYVLHTFPTDGANKDKYLDGLSPVLAKKDKPNYDAAVTANVNANSVHALIHVTSGGGTPGVTLGSPRQAIIREDGFFSSKFDKDFTLVFAQLLGLKSATISSPNDFKPLADALPNTLTGVKLTFE